MGDANYKIQLFGTRGSAEAYLLRDFMHRCQWIELTSDEQARTLANVTGLSDTRMPVCVFSDGTRLEHSTVRQVGEELGLFRNPSRTEYDLSIYGAGPAGLRCRALRRLRGIEGCGDRALCRGWPSRHQPQD
jgi:thioredoxin reductase (NADPH)